jgi:hypothetical protein
MPPFGIPRSISGSLIPRTYIYLAEVLCPDQSLRSESADDGTRYVEFRGCNKRAKLLPLTVGPDTFFPPIFEQFPMFLLYPL